MANDLVVKEKIAVLFSPGFGAGWSTWNGEIPATFMTMDAGLVEMAKADASVQEVEEYIMGRFPDCCGYFGGWHDITIAQIPAGTLFKIQEYDGSESITFLEDSNWILAA